MINDDDDDDDDGDDDDGNGGIMCIHAWLWPLDSLRMTIL